MSGKNNILSGVLIVAVLLLAVLIYIKLDRIENGLTTSANQVSYFSENPGKDDKEQREPYIDGAVKNTIRKRFSGIQKVYLEYLKSAPQKTEGKIEIDWQIDAEGNVISPEVIFSEFNNDQLEKGILNAVLSIKFPPPPYGRRVYVAHKFNFKTE